MLYFLKEGWTLTRSGIAVAKGGKFAPQWCGSQGTLGAPLCDALRLLAALFFLYLFLLSIALMGKAFALFGIGLAKQIIDFTSSPLIGLFVGILATSLV
jgi:hypothetical protein